MLNDEAEVSPGKKGRRGLPAVLGERGPRSDVCFPGL